jgi:hypothetical protein
MRCALDKCYFKFLEVIGTRVAYQLRLDIAIEVQAHELFIDDVLFLFLSEHAHVASLFTAKMRFS